MEGRKSTLFGALTLDSLAESDQYVCAINSLLRNVVLRRRAAGVIYLRRTQQFAIHLQNLGREQGITTIYHLAGAPDYIWTGAMKYSAD